jgi:hypothetical protein
MQNEVASTRQEGGSRNDVVASTRKEGGSRNDVRNIV